MTMAEGGMMASGYTLIIGDKNFSSWSLRPWIAMKRFGIPFAEQRIWLRQPESKRSCAIRHRARCRRSRRAGLVVCDSLAILEYLAESHPELHMWPSDAEARAVARSISAEMHSGFVTLRNEMSMDLLAKFPTPPIGDELAHDISRIVAIWRETRERYGAGGPFLFGTFSNADAMYAPVATRFRTYAVDLAAFGDEGMAAAYAEAILASPEMAEWTEGAKAEVRARLAG